MHNMIKLNIYIHSVGRFVNLSKIEYPFRATTGLMQDFYQRDRSALPYSLIATTLQHFVSLGVGNYCIQYYIHTYRYWDVNLIEYPSGAS